MFLFTYLDRYIAFVLVIFITLYLWILHYHHLLSFHNFNISKKTTREEQCNPKSKSNKFHPVTHNNRKNQATGVKSADNLCSHKLSTHKSNAARFSSTNPNGWTSTTSTTKSSSTVPNAAQNWAKWSSQARNAPVANGSPPPTRSSSLKSIKSENSDFDRTISIPIQE